MTEHLVNHCPNCGAEIEPEEEFCRECIEKHELVPCPLCEKIVCACEVGVVD